MSQRLLIRGWVLLFGSVRVGRQERGKSPLLPIAFVLAALALPARELRAINQYFFDWDNANVGSGTNFADMPDLTDDPAIVASARARLTQQQALGKPLAVRISTPLASNGPAIQLLNQFAVQYVFADFSPGNAVTQTGNLVNQVQGTSSKNAFIGNLGFYPGAAQDPTHGASTPDAYTPAHPTMANPVLFPGGADYRTPANGSNSALGGSDAPNIRSAAFTLPLERLTMAVNGVYGRGTSLGITNNGSASDTAFAVGFKSAPVIPYLTRFNNFGNAALNNSPAQGFHFTSTAANPADGQLLSRGDFEALVLQTRMRGADSLNLFKPVFIDRFGNDYTDTQQELDANTGWFVTGQPGSGGNVVNAIFATHHYGFASLANLVSIDTNRPNGTPLRSNFEAQGIAYSGVYSEAPGGIGVTVGAAAFRDQFGVLHPAVPASQLVLLISNLSNTTKTVDLGTLAGRYVFTPNDPNGIGQDDITVEAGAHRLVTFTLKNQAGLGLGTIARQNANGLPVWDETSNTLVFTNDDRDGTGSGISTAIAVPEPGAVLAVALSGVMLLRRR